MQAWSPPGTRASAIAAVTMADSSRRAYQLSPQFKNRKDRTQQTYNIYLRGIETEMGEAPVAEIERRDIQTLLDKLQDRPGAANMTLAVLRNLFKHALKREWVQADPTRDIEVVEGSGNTHEPWPKQLVIAALTDPQVSLPVALLYYTAQRIGDV